MFASTEDISIATMENLQDMETTARFARTVWEQEIGLRFSRAIGLHQQGDLDAANLAYLQVLAVLPEHLGALNNLALISGDAEAADYYTRVLTADPYYLNTLINFGFLKLRIGHVEEALSLFVRAAARDQEDPRVLQGLCRTTTVLLEAQRQPAVPSGSDA
jgi:tetratricopeptide (TPR) repeat protein